jgi:hypothetical protein
MVQTMGNATIERLTRERDRLQAENAGLRRGRITAHVHTWADGQVEPGESDHA